MNRKQLDEYVSKTHVRMEARLIRNLEAKQKKQPLTEAEQSALDRAKRLQARRR